VIDKERDVKRWQMGDQRDVPTMNNKRELSLSQSILNKGELVVEFLFYVEEMSIVK